MIPKRFKTKLEYFNAVEQIDIDKMVIWYDNFKAVQNLGIEIFNHTADVVAIIYDLTTNEILEILLESEL